MRFQLMRHGWPLSVGGTHFARATLIPEGTIVDASLPQWAALTSPGGPLATGRLPPLNARPLDQATFDLMKSGYRDDWQVRQIITVLGDGINR